MLHICDMELIDFKFIGVNYLNPNGIIDACWQYNGKQYKARVTMQELFQFYQDNPAVWVNLLSKAGVTHSFNFIITDYEHLSEFLKAFIIKNHYGTE